MDALIIEFMDALIIEFMDMTLARCLFCPDSVANADVPGCHNGDSSLASFFFSSWMSQPAAFNSFSRARHVAVDHHRVSSSWALSM
jgi:hypothetical protein